MSFVACHSVAIECYRLQSNGRNALVAPLRNDALVVDSSSATASCLAYNFGPPEAAVTSEE